GALLPADHEIRGAPSVVFDAVAILPSADGGAKLAAQAEAVNFLRDAYGHLKVVAFTPGAAPVFAKAGLSDADDAGLVPVKKGGAGDFVQRAAGGRIWDREPLVHPVF
ncbi:MAG: catalase HPII, partial [Phenylobacterium sp.]